MDLGLAGRRALVGGGSSGLGAAIATSLAGEGARVAVAARGSDRLEKQAASIDGLAVPADLSTTSGPVDAVTAAIDAFGGLDLLFAKGVIAVFGSSENPSLGAFDALISLPFESTRLTFWL